MAGVRQSSEGSGLLGGEHAAQRCGVADLLRYNAARSRGAPGHARTASVLFLFVLLSITTPEDPWLELASSGLVFGCLLTLCCTFWVSQCPTVPVLLVTWICLSLEVQKWHLSDSSKCTDKRLKHILWLVLVAPPDQERPPRWKNH
jgi:hypothetical protein